jgi:hypothetical protein
MFRAMFSPIIRSTWLYLQYLVVYCILLVIFVFLGYLKFAEISKEPTTTISYPEGGRDKPRP